MNSKYAILFVSEDSEKSASLEHSLASLAFEYQLAPTTTFNFKTHFDQFKEWLRKTPLFLPVVVIEANHKPERACEAAKFLLPYFPEKIKYITICLDRRYITVIPTLNDLALSHKKIIKQTDYELVLRETGGLIDAFFQQLRYI